MPNHIRNRLTFTGKKSDIEKLVNKYTTHFPPREITMFSDKDIVLVHSKEDSKYIGWYNKKTNIIKIPGPDGKDRVIDFNSKFWEIQMGESWTEFPDFEKILPRPEHIDEEDMDWNIACWGTKWSCYRCKKISDNIYEFHTAWKPVPILILILARLNPNVEIVYEHADEDVGVQCGKHIFRNGRLFQKHFYKTHSKEAFDLYYKLHPEEIKDH